MTDPRDIALFIDPFTHHFDGDVMFDVTADQLNGDNILAPWSYLRQWFNARGIRVHTADKLLSGQVRGKTNVYVSFGLDRYRKLARRPGVTLSAFFAFESPIVEPSQYTGLARVQQSFRRIFTFTDAQSLQPFLTGPLHSQLFHLPTPSDSVNEEIWRRQDRKFLVMINHNKLPAVYWQELYTERMRAGEFFSRTGEIDLYGLGWDGPSFQMGKTWMPGTLQRLKRGAEKAWQRVRPDPLLQAARRVYRGAAASKAETLGQYTFSICFENMVLKAWITEKLFDCFVVGTIPIYWGAPDVEDYVPEECFIDMRRFSGYAELRSYLRSLGPGEIRRFRDGGRAYLASPQFRPFTKHAFTDLLAQIVEQDTGVSLSAPPEAPMNSGAGA